MKKINRRFFLKSLFNLGLFSLIPFKLKALNFLEENPKFKKELTTPKIISGIEGKTHKVDNGFTENMQRISEAHPNSPMAEKFGTNRTNKDKKTFNTVKKRTSIGKSHNMNNIAKEYRPGQLVK